MTHVLLLKDFVQQSQTVFEATMLNWGFHKEQRHQWSVWENGRQMLESNRTDNGSRTPRGWLKKLHNVGMPRHFRASAKSLTKTLAFGRTWVTSGASLKRHGSACWREKIPAVVESVTRRLAEMRSDLSGENPSAIEKAIVDQIVITWLQVRALEVGCANMEKKNGGGKIESSSYSARFGQQALHSGG